MSSCPRWTLRTTSATARTRRSSRAGTSAWGRPGPRPRPWWVQSPATGLRPGGDCNYITRETITSCFSFMTWVSQTGCHTDFILNQWTACWSFTRQKFWRTWTRWADIAGEEFISCIFQYAQYLNMQCPSWLQTLYWFQRKGWWHVLKLQRKPWMPISSTNNYYFLVCRHDGA